MALQNEILIDTLLESLTTRTGGLETERALIDVRSEGEFQEGHIPGFINLPILNDEERHLVGLTYKREGQEKAIIKGHELLAPNKMNRISAWKALADRYSNPPVVTCWRGGLRSKITCQWLSEAGVPTGRLIGGYKMFRRKILDSFEHPPLKIIVLSGMTGTGKTELLRHLPIPTIDLEKLAHHRGSAYGWHLKGEQPTQSNFENPLGLALMSCQNLPLVLEDESGHIGSVGLPATLKLKMKSSPIVILEEPVEIRIRWIAEDYIFRPLREGHSLLEIQNHLLESLSRLKRKIGGLAFQQIHSMIRQAFLTDPMKIDSHEDWIGILLESYYDKMYQFSLNKQNRPILFKGNRRGALKWFQDHGGDLISSHFPWPQEKKT